jgi:hypothetical protein
VNFMALKYPLVHELVIVVADLYLPEEGSADSLALPGLERIARFATKSVLAAGWRPWLARHVGAAALAGEPPALIAARCCSAEVADAAWLATPVHYIAGLSSLHLEHRGLLKLPMATLTALAEDFREVFQGSDFALEALPSGGFLLRGPAVAEAQTIEPARCVGTSIAAALPRNAALRRLGAEIEIWLHEHPVNLARRARAELAVTGLWIWGGGTAPHPPRVRSGTCSENARAYGRDPYLDGLWCARGASARALPESIAALLEESARSSVIVVELAELLATDMRAGVGDALALLDARFLAPAAELLARGALGSLTLIANDRCLILKRRDSMKRWRRSYRGLAALA